MKIHPNAEALRGLFQALDPSSQATILQAVTMAIECAVMVEREECAAIAADELWPDGDSHDVSQWIASTIRARGEGEA